jgi:FkbM family methyltransferase
MKHQLKFLAEQVFNQKIRKYSYLNRFDELLRKYNVKNVIDIGANTGQFIDWAYLSLKRREIEIFSFEPLKEPFKELSSKAQGRRRFLKWNCYPFALSDSSGTALINVSSGDATSSSLHELAIESLVRNVRQETVDLRVFDDLDISSEDLKNVLVKIDVQGHEMKVLLGMEKFVSRVRPIILLEVSNVSSYVTDLALVDYLNYFKDANYRLLWIEHNIVDLTIDREWDLCFVHQDNII